ncbi:MAG: cell division protein ZapA [Hylemonella sp.]|nr:cell division protein ZapA [Hylemonella sp.]
MKQIEVQIMGQSYLLGCPEGGEVRLREAVEQVNGTMCQIRDGGKVRARDRIAVLAALNLASELSDRLAEPTASIAAPVGATEAVHGATDQQLRHLVLRLDAALGKDGRLL